MGLFTSTHLWRHNIFSKAGGLLAAACALAAVCLAPVQAQETRIATPTQQRLDIQRHVRPDNYEMLLVGEEEYPIIIQEANIALTKGVALLVPEAGRSPTSGVSIAPLTQHLNDIGWATMIVPAPVIGFEAAEKKAMMQDKSGEMADGQGEMADSSQAPFSGQTVFTEEIFKQHEQQMVQLLNAATQKSGEYPGFFLVIAEGTSAAWIAKIYAEEQVAEPDALVTISANWPMQEYNKQVSGFLATSAVPVLDIYTQWDNQWALTTAKARRIAAAKELKVHYRQRQLLGYQYTPDQYAFLSREIYGWLTFMGW